MNRPHIRAPRGAQPPVQVMLERAALGFGAPDDALAAQRRRSEAERSWREGVVTKVRDGRWADLTPEERGLILAALAPACPDA